MKLNEEEQRIFLICIRFGSCEVRRLTRALVCFISFFFCELFFFERRTEVFLSLPSFTLFGSFTFPAVTTFLTILTYPTQNRYLLFQVFFEKVSKTCRKRKKEYKLPNAKMEGKNFSKGRDKIRLGNKTILAAWKLCNCNHSGRVKSKLSRMVRRWNLPGDQTNVAWT